MRYMQSYECSPEDVISITILAIALLCEHLHEVLYRIYYRHSTEDPWNGIPKFNWRDEDADCAMIVVDRLTMGGRCPHTLAGMGIYTSKIETLWYYTNLEPPKIALGHAGCTMQQCVHLQIDHSIYQTKHTQGGCRCDHVGPDPVALAGIVMDGKLPLARVVFGAAGQIDKIDVQAREADTMFVAVSHVWADGHGNPAGNLLPSCFLRELQVAVDDIAGAKTFPFWMDTLCIPREPRSVRRQALKKLRDPYEYAAHVLVLDAYLQSQQSQDCSIVELVALVNVSSWAQRLWTFQEGRLAKDIRIQFADGIIRMSDGDAAKDALQSKVISEVPADIFTFHTSTTSTNQFWSSSDAGFTSVLSLRAGVRLRSTSVATDEALCLGSIVGLDMEKILDQSEADRMTAFWTMIPSIPAGIGMSKTCLKLEAKGLRWAPASLMGEIDLVEWDGPSSMSGEVAELSPQGLVCRLSALKFPPIRLPVFAICSETLCSIARNEDHEYHLTCDSINLKTHDGEWLACVFEEAWHQAPIDIVEGEIPAILLEQPTYMLDGSRPTEILSGDNISALFVSYTPSLGGDRRQAHGIRHCSLYFLSQTQCAFLDELDTITHQLLDKNWDAVTAKQDNWEEIFHYLESLIPDYVLNGPCLPIGRDALTVLRGTDDFDDQAVVDNAVVIIASFCFIGPNRYVDNEGERESWVID